MKNRIKNKQTFFPTKEPLTIQVIYNAHFFHERHFLHWTLLVEDVSNGNENTEFIGPYFLSHRVEALMAFASKAWFKNHGGGSCENITILV